MNSEQQPQKLEKVTNTLQKYWFLFFYLIFLPIAISSVVAYIVRNFIPGEQIWLEELSICIFLLLVLPLCILFSLLADKYLKNRFYIKDEAPKFKHILIYIGSSIVPLIYTSIINFSLQILDFEYFYFFDETSLFLRIIYPVISFLGLIFYFLTRKFPKIGLSLTDLRNQTQENSIIVIAFLVRIISIEIFPAGSVYSLLIIDLIIGMISGIIYKKAIDKDTENNQSGIIDECNSENLNSEESENIDGEVPIEQQEIEIIQDNDVEMNGSLSSVQKISFISLPASIKSHIFFNIFPALHIISILFLILWNTGIFSIDLGLMIFLSIFAVCIGIKSGFLMYYFQLKRTSYIEVVKKGKIVYQINSITTLICYTSGLLIYILDPTNIINQIFGIGLLIFLIWLIFKESEYKLLNVRFVAYFSLIISTTVSIGLGSIIITIIELFIELELIYVFLVYSILLYLNLEYMIHKKIINKESIAVIQAMLASVIIMEVFFGISNWIISNQISMLPDPNLELLYRVLVLSLTFIISSIFSLLIVYFTRLNQRTNLLLKIIFGILHITLTIICIILFSFNVGGYLDLFSPQYFIFTHYLLPTILFNLLNLVVIRIYSSFRIISRVENAKISLVFADIISFLVGLSIVVILQTLSSFLILSFLLTLSIVLHHFILFKMQLITAETYQSRINYFALLLFIELYLTLLLVQIQNLNLTVDLAIIFTSIITIGILKLLNQMKDLFSKKFSYYFTLFNLILLSICIPIYISGYLLNFFIGEASIYYKIISILPQITLFVMSNCVIIVYSIKNGHLFSNIWVSVTNIFAIVQYVLYALFPLYVLEILRKISVIILSDQDTIQFGLILFFSILILLNYADDKRLHYLHNGPKVWILKAIRSKNINIVDGSNSIKNRKKIEKTLALWLPSSEDEENNVITENNIVNNEENVDNTNIENSMDGNENNEDKPINNLINSPISLPKTPFDLINSNLDASVHIFKMSFIQHFIQHFSWICTLISIILNILFIHKIFPQIEIGLIFSLPISGILLFVFLYNLRNSGIISFEFYRKLKSINLTYFFISLSYIIYILARNYIPFEINLSLKTIFSLELALIFLKIMFGLMKNSILRLSPKFYYTSSAYIWNIISINSVLFIVIGLREFVFYQSFLSMFEPIVDNAVFMVTLSFFIFSLFLNKSLSYYKKYNISILRQITYLNEFPSVILNNEDMVSKIKDFAQKGIGDHPTEQLIRSYFIIKKVYTKNKMLFIFEYLLFSIIPFEILINLGINFPEISATGLIIESILSFFVAAYILLFIDRQRFKNLQITTNYKITFVIWAGLSIFGSLYLAILLESSIIGMITFSLLGISICLVPLNYYFENTGKDSPNWDKIKERVVEISLLFTSSLYLIVISVNVAINYSGYQVIGESEYSVVFLRLLPVIYTGLFVSFYWTLLNSFVKPVQFLRRALLGLIPSIIAIRLLNLDINLIEIWISNGYTWGFKIFQNPHLFKLFGLQFLNSFIVALGLIFTTFFVFNSVKKQNFISKTIYDILEIFIGVILINNIIFEPFILFISGRHAPASPDLYGTAINPGLVDYIWFERFSIAFSLTIIIYYYVRRSLYVKFGEKEDLLEQNVAQEIGMLTGIARSFGFSFGTFSTLSLIKVVYSLSITTFSQISVINPTMSNMLNTAFSWAVSLFLFSISFYYFIRIYLRKFEKTSYRVRFIFRIIAVISAACAIAIPAIIYSHIFNFIIPVILVACWIVLVKMQRKNPYRAGIIIGTAKGLVVLILVYWSFHYFIGNPIFAYFGQYNPVGIQDLIRIRNTFEICFSLGVTGFVLSRSIKNLYYKVKKVLIPLILCLSVTLICISNYVLLTHIDSLLTESVIYVDQELGFLLTFDLGIFLFYFAIGIYNWSFKRKQIWDAGWWLWLLLPIINFSIFLNIFNGIDVIAKTFNLIGGMEVSGSLILTILISSAMYFPVIITKFKKLFNYAFLIIWFEAIGLWIWLASQINQIFSLSYLLSGLFIAGLAFITLIPLFYRLKLYKFIAIIWAVIAVSNAVFLSLFIEITAFNDIFIDIAINLFIYGIFLMLFSSNPAVKNKWEKISQGIQIGFALTVFGLSFILFGIFLTVTTDYIYAINLSLIISGSLLLSGKSSKIHMFSKKINWYVSVIIGINTGSLVYRVLWFINPFPLKFEISSRFISILTNIDPFAASVGLAFATAILLFSQLRRYVSRENWRYFYAVFALSIGLLISTLIQSVVEINLFNYLGLFFLISTFITYPSVYRIKLPFWFMLSTSFTFFIEGLVVNFLNLLIPEIVVGITYFELINWMILFLVISSIILSLVSIYYTLNQEKYMAVLKNYSLVNDEGNIIHLDHLDGFSAQSKKNIARSYKRLDKIPLFFKNSKNTHRYCSISYLISLYLLGSIVSRLINLNILSQIFLFIFVLSISNFNFLYYTKKKEIFQNATFRLIFKELSAYLLYLSLGYGMSIGFMFFSRFILSFFEIGISSIITIILNISMISLGYYLTFNLFDNNLKILKVNTNLSLKIVSWVIFMISFIIFTYLLTSNIFPVLIIISLLGFNLNRHAKKFINAFTKELQLNINLSKSELNTEEIDAIIENISQNPNEDNVGESAQQETLGLDSPVLIEPPETIIKDDIISNVNFDELSDSLEDIFNQPADNEGLPGVISSVDPSISQIGSSDNQTEEIPNQYEISYSPNGPVQSDYKMKISEKLIKLEKRQKQAIQFKLFINIFDTLIKQSFIVELSYLLTIILAALLPKNDFYVVPFNYFLEIFIFTLSLSIFYNYTRILSAKYRIKIAQILMSTLMVSTILLPIGIFNIYKNELRFIGDGVFAPVGTYHVPNLIFLICFTMLILLLELLKMVKNYASTKNINLQKQIVDRWTRFIHPALLLLIAFTIGNFVSYSEPLLTRLTIASFILFAEIILDHFVFHFYQRFTRARFLLQSWLLCCLLAPANLIWLALNHERPISIGLLTVMVIIGMQFITVWFKYNLENEKIIREFGLTKDQISRIRQTEKDKLIQLDDENNKYSENQIDNTIDKPISNDSPSNDHDENYEEEIVPDDVSDVKLLNFAKFKVNWYNILGIMFYVSLGLFVCVEIYERIIFKVINEEISALNSAGAAVFSVQGASLLLWLSFIVFIPILVSLIGVFLDTKILRLLKPLSRDITLLVNWILTTIYLILTSSLFEIRENGSGINVISPGLYFAVSIFQYYTMYLITNIILHSVRKLQISELYENFSIFDSEDYKKKIMEIVGIDLDWNLIMNQKNSSERRRFFLKLIASVEPKKLKIAKRINTIIGIFVYIFIGFSTYEFFVNLTSLVLFSVFMGLLVIYLQSELNYYKIKSFSEKYNFVFTAGSWLLLSIGLSLLPLLLWNNNPSSTIAFADLQPLFFMISNMVYVMFVLVLFNFSMFYTALIMRRYFNQIDVKLKWFKFLRVSLYILISITVFVALYPTSINFALAMASIMLYIEMIIENQKPILLKRSVIIIKIIAGMGIIASCSTWIFKYISLEFLNLELAITASLFVGTVLFPVVYNPFKNKKVLPFYWLLLSIESGLVMNQIITGENSYGIITGVVFMLLYPVFFEFEKLIQIVKKIIAFFQQFFLNIREFFIKLWTKIKEFILKNKILLNLLVSAVIATVLFFLIQGFFSKITQSIAISANIGAITLYPLFSRKEKEMKDESTFSKQLYYALLVYISGNFTLYTFVTINIIWFLLSALIISTILLVVIYRREKIYNLSVKWRFGFLMLTIILAVVLIALLVLMLMGLVQINF